ncbi:hypothetical protein HD806DRAFT_482265 [Xylariaceae sp. AK1471]|nr:hypothetical protein HD806DRAFT_482265 [Xylariaceae sp. AK1471]
MDIPVDSSTLPHDNRAHVLVIVVVILLSIATLSVGLRIYTRVCLLKQVGADDYLSLLALGLAIATGISQCINTRYGLGKHVWDLELPEEIMAYLKNFYVSIIFYNTGLMVVKLTFLTQYYRVLVSRRFRIICAVAMVIIGLWSFSQVLVGIFICLPVAGFWDSSLNPQCIPTPLQWYINAAGNIVTDIAIFVMPLPVLVRLKLPKAQRLSLVGIFSLGFFTCAISVIRIKFLKQGGDFSYENIEGSSWSIAELCSGVTCCSLPTLRPFLAKYVPALASRIQRSSMEYLRRSGSRATDVGRGSKHTRQGSKEESNGIGSEDALYRRDIACGVYRSTSGDTSSDGIMGLRSTKESLSGGKVTTPKATHVPTISQTRTRADTQLNWLQPSVTTIISTGGSRREPRTSHDRPATIQITRDVMMQKLSFSKM